MGLIEAVGGVLAVAPAWLDVRVYGVDCRGNAMGAFQSMAI
jgi:hypothetical protein